MKKEYKKLIEESIDSLVDKYIKSYDMSLTPKTVKECREKFAALKEAKELLFYQSGCVVCRKILPFFQVFIEKWLRRKSGGHEGQEKDL